MTIELFEAWLAQTHNVIGRDNWVSNAFLGEAIQQPVFELYLSQLNINLLQDTEAVIQQKLKSTLEDADMDNVTSIENLINNDDPNK
jgi:hypothetical protein